MTTDPNESLNTRTPEYMGNARVQVKRFKVNSITWSGVRSALAKLGAEELGPTSNHKSHQFRFPNGKVVPAGNNTNRDVTNAYLDQLLCNVLAAKVPLALFLAVVGDEARWAQRHPLTEALKKLLRQRRGSYDLKNSAEWPKLISSANATLSMLTQLEESTKEEPIIIQPNETPAAAPEATEKAQEPEQEPQATITLSEALSEALKGSEVEQGVEQRIYARLYAVIKGTVPDLGLRRSLIDSGRVKFVGHKETIRLTPDGSTEVGLKALELLDEYVKAGGRIHAKPVPYTKGSGEGVMKPTDSDNIVAMSPEEHEALTEPKPVEQPRTMAATAAAWEKGDEPQPPECPPVWGGHAITPGRPNDWGDPQPRERRIQPGESHYDPFRQQPSPPVGLDNEFPELILRLCKTTGTMPVLDGWQVDFKATLQTCVEVAEQRNA